MEESDQDKIEKLKKSLYSRKGSDRNAHILDLHKHEARVDSTWHVDDIPREKDYEQEEEISSGRVSSFLKKGLFVAGIFFVVSIGVAGFVYYTGNNLISPDKIDITVTGPIMTAAGEPISLDISVSNRNKTALEIADLVIEYPKGTKKVVDRSTDLPRERFSLGRIESGATVKNTVELIPFGEDDASLEIVLKLVYRVLSSSSSFEKRVTHSFIIGFSPITLSVNALKEITSNKSFDFKVDITSNSNEIIRNLILIATTPFGYVLERSDPAPISGKTAWRLGDIEPQGKRSIRITGKIIGEEQQNRVFKFTTGTENSDKVGTIDATLAGVFHDISITKPFLGAEILISRSRGAEYYAQNGENINLTVEYQNNLSVPIENAEITVNLNGAIIDKTSIDSENGFYDSNTNTIKWTRFEQEGLAQIVPGASGNVAFGIRIIKSDNSILNQTVNPEAIISVDVKGRRLSETDVPEEIVSTAVRKIKLTTNPRLFASVVHSIGSIENIGGIPPKVGNITEYSILLAVANDYNDMNEVTVSAILPSYVTWTNVTSPSSEKVTYDSNSRRVVWDLGKLPAKTFTNSMRRVSFQVSINPSTSQVGTSPVLVNNLSLKGTDAFTNVLVSSNVVELNTKMPTDPNYIEGADKVIE